jgi:DNA-binding MarR family transcriptional regulator
MNVTQKQICEDIVQLLNKLKNSMSDIAEEQGITRIQLFALYSIDNAGELAMGKMADVLHCDPSNITGIVERLVQQELVTRLECPLDRRAKKLRLTPKGKEMVTILEDALPARIGCDKLDQQECNVLHPLIQKICRSSVE